MDAISNQQIQDCRHELALANINIEQLQIYQRLKDNSQARHELKVQKNSPVTAKSNAARVESVALSKEIKRLVQPYVIANQQQHVGLKPRIINFYSISNNGNNAGSKPRQKKRAKTKLTDHEDNEDDLSESQGKPDLNPRVENAKPALTDNKKSAQQSPGQAALEKNDGAQAHTMLNRADPEDNQGFLNSEELKKFI